MGGAALVHGIEAVVGAASTACRPRSIVVGALMSSGSATVDVRPFRRRLIVLAVASLLVLGDAHGGALGAAPTTASGACSAGPAS